MKITMLLIFAILAATSLPAQEYDSLPNWNFYYKKKIVLQGGSAVDTTTTATVNVNRRRPGNLVVTVNYDVASTFESALVVREDGRDVKRLRFTGNPSGVGSAPSIRTGSDFVIPLEELPGPVSGKPRRLEFYYSDNRWQDKLIGSIVLVTDR